METETEKEKEEEEARALTLNSQGLVAVVPQRRHRAGPWPLSVCLHAPPSIKCLVNYKTNRPAPRLSTHTPTHTHTHCVSQPVHTHTTLKNQHNSLNVLLFRQACRSHLMCIGLR